MNRNVLPDALLPQKEQSLTEDNIQMNIDVDPTVMNQVMHDIHAHTGRNGSMSNLLPPPNIPNIPTSSPNRMALPSNDIPRNAHAESLMHDETASPTYVPPPENGPRRPLPTHEASAVQNQLKRKKHRQNFMDGLLDDIKQPVLISLLYFLFQLPCTTAILRKVVPFFYKEDLNLNLLGMGMLSVAFAMATILVTRAQDEILQFLT